MIETTLLTIAIPTYNRAAYLGELLPMLTEAVSLVNFEAPIVEILVVDNASTDTTQDVISSIIAERRFVRASRNGVNIGGDRNFIECVRLSRGAYVWLFGDDDLLLNGGVSRVVNLLREHRPALLIATSYQPRTKVFTDYRTALRSCLVFDMVFPLHHTLITANVFRRSLFDFATAENRLSTSYAHMYGLKMIIGAGKVIVLGKRHSAVGIRETRAPFDVPPVDLASKVIGYNKWLARETESLRLRFAIFAFFSVVNVVNSWIRPAKRLLKNMIVNRTVLK